MRHYSQSISVSRWCAAGNCLCVGMMFSSLQPHSNEFLFHISYSCDSLRCFSLVFLVPAKPQMQKNMITSRWHFCRSSDAAPEVLCWVQSSCFANMPLRCISVRSVGMAAGCHATMKGCCPFRPTDAPLNPEASRRPNAKTSGWRCAPRSLQRPWSRCLGEFHGWGWDKIGPMQEIHGPWFHRASSASLLDINHAVQSKSQVVAVDNLWLCVAITLGMALVTGLAQPFAQPQMNVLQSACFACA